MSSRAGTEQPYSFGQEGTFALPYELTIPASLVLEADTATATFDGTSASGSFVPCLSLYSPSGTLIASIPIQTATLSAGDTAEVSWFPFAPAAISGGSGGGSGLQYASGTYGADNVGDALIVEATGTAGQEFSEPNANPFGIEGTFSAGFNYASGALYTVAPGASNPVLSVMNNDGTNTNQAAGLNVEADATLNGKTSVAAAIAATSTDSESTGVTVSSQTDSGVALGLQAFADATGSTSGDAQNVVKARTAGGDALGLNVIAGDYPGHTTTGTITVLKCDAVDGAATVTTVFQVDGDGKVLADQLPTSNTGLPAGAIWNNAGVLNIGAGGSGGGVTSLQADANTPLTGAVELASGTNVTLSQSGQIITVSASGGGGPTQYDYVERTTDLSVTATSKSTAQTFIDGNAVTYDGSTRIKIEFWTQLALAAINQYVIITLWDGTTDLNRIGQVGSASVGATVKGERFLTPSAGSHTFHIKAWTTGGTSTLYAAAASEALPAFLRITQA